MVRGGKRGRRSMAAARSAQEVADALEEAAALLEVADPTPYRARAYQRGAQAVRLLGVELEHRLEAGTLTEVTGIGDGLRAVIELLARGEEPRSWSVLRQSTPPGLREVARLKGIGVKKARLLQ